MIELVPNITAGSNLQIIHEPDPELARCSPAPSAPSCAKRTSQAVYAAVDENVNKN